VAVNALPYTGDLRCEINVADTKRENFSNAQAQNRGHREDGAERFWRSRWDFSDFFITEAPLLFLLSIAVGPIFANGSRMRAREVYAAFLRDRLETRTRGARLASGN